MLRSRTENALYILIAAVLFAFAANGLLSDRSFYRTAIEAKATVVSRSPLQSVHPVTLVYEFDTQKGKISMTKTFHLKREYRARRWLTILAPGDEFRIHYLPSSPHTVRIDILEHSKLTNVLVCILLFFFLMAAIVNFYLFEKRK